MTEELKKLKKEFEKIKLLGYVKSTRKGYTGIGKTFEDLLGKAEDNLSKPDFQGIEIKTKRAYSKSYTTLFNATPMGNSDSEIKRLRITYGYPEFTNSKIKILNCSVQASCSTFVAQKYLFKLYISYEEEKIYLIIYNQSFVLIEKKVYWPFSLIKERLEQKLQYMALIKAWPNIISGEEYYKYYDIDFYKLKTFTEFLKLIEDGTIRITFKIGVFKDGSKKNQIHDRGTGFEIQELDLLKLFEKITV